MIDNIFRKFWSACTSLGRKQKPPEKTHVWPKFCSFSLTIWAEPGEASCKTLCFCLENQRINHPAAASRTCTMRGGSAVSFWPNFDEKWAWVQEGIECQAPGFSYDPISGLWQRGQMPHSFPLDVPSWTKLHQQAALGLGRRGCPCLHVNMHAQYATPAPIIPIPSMYFLFHGSLLSKITNITGKNGHGPWWEPPCFIILFFWKILIIIAA